MAPIIKLLHQQQDRVRSVICVTGQHREMLTRCLRCLASGLTSISR